MINGHPGPKRSSGHETVVWAQNGRIGTKRSFGHKALSQKLRDFLSSVPNNVLLGTGQCPVSKRSFGHKRPFYAQSRALTAPPRPFRSSDNLCRVLSRSPPRSHAISATPSRDFRSAFSLFPPLAPAISAPPSRYFRCALPPSPPHPFVIPTASSPDLSRMLTQSALVGTRTTGVTPLESHQVVASRREGGVEEMSRGRSGDGGAEMAEQKSREGVAEMA
jgi:hypothetical protein